MKQNFTHLVLGVALTYMGYGQSEFFPDQTLYTESFQVAESVTYYLRDEGQEEQLTEFDYIDMEPYEENLLQERYMSESFQYYSKITILSSDLANEWDHQIDYIVSDPEGSRVYTTEGEIVSDLPHSQAFIEKQLEYRSEIIEQGVDVLTPFPAFEELDYESLTESGYDYEPIDDYSYKIWDSYGETTVFPQANTTVYNSFEENLYDSPFFISKIFDVSSQGLLIPIEEVVQTRIASENGVCIIKEEVNTYSNYNLFYSEEIVAGGLPEVGTEVDFGIYPNPSSHEIQITYNGSQYDHAEYELSIWDQFNQEHLSIDNLNTGEVEVIEVSMLEPGYYYIRISIESEQYTKLLLKN